MNKQDYKKDYKNLYLPKNSPCIIDVPPMQFAAIDGSGDPNGEEFSLAVSALYSFSYTVKMSYKSKAIPEGFYDYTVFPLEGVWDLGDKTKPVSDKSNYVYSIMIRQPDFLTNELFARFVDETRKKKPNVFLDKIRYINISEGLCCQMLHLGGYDTESASFQIMEHFCEEDGYKRISRRHREIYISNPLKSGSDKLKTVLRFNVSKTNGDSL